jgi:uncharacterized membrane protein
MLHSLIKWIHLLATIAWIGSMFANFFIYMPVITKNLDPPAAVKLLRGAMKRTRIAVYFSIGLLMLSGVMLVSMYGMESGRMNVGDAWFLFFLGKMFLVVLMVLLSLFAFEVLAPRIARQAEEGASARLNRMQRKQRVMALTVFVLGLVIVLFSSAL